MTILKAYVWLLKQMFKLIWNVYKLFVCLFPAAGIVLAALVVFECAGFVTGNDYIGKASDFVSQYVHAAAPTPLDNAVNGTSQNADISKTASDVSGYASSITDGITSDLQKNIESGVSDISEQVTKTLLQTVTSWWEGILERSEQKAYMVIAWAITILVGIPIFLGLLFLSAAASGFHFIGIAIICDLVLYIARSIFGMTTPFRQFRRRYCFLFHTKPFYDPKYEDSYQDWLKRHHDEFENDTFGTGNAYDDDYDPDEDYNRVGKRDFEGRRVTRKEAKKLERIRKRQQNYDDYYEDYYDRLESQEDEDDDYDSDHDQIDTDTPEDEEYEDYRDYKGYRQSRRSNKKYSRKRSYDSYYDDEEDDDDYYEEQRTRKQSSRKSNFETFDFFAGCRSRDGVVKKYHSLAKLYHPDNLEGDSSAITEINRQYKEAIGKYK
jgi:hypothetical protein